MAGGTGANLPWDGIGGGVVGVGSQRVVVTGRQVGDWAGRAGHDRPLPGMIGGAGADRGATAIDGAGCAAGHRVRGAGPWAII
jgi:hypothetical protein